MGTSRSPRLHRAAVLPLSVQSAQQSQSWMPRAARERGWQMHGGRPLKWQNLRLFCLHRKRLNLTPVPDFLHQKHTSFSVPLQLPCVFGLSKGKKILLFAIFSFSVDIEQDF